MARVFRLDTVDFDVGLDLLDVGRDARHETAAAHAAEDGVQSLAVALPQDLQSGPAFVSKRQYAR